MQITGTGGWGLQACADIRTVCGLSGKSPRKKKGGQFFFPGFWGVTQLWSEKDLLFITSTHKSTDLLRLPGSTLFPGIVVLVSDPVLRCLSAQILIFG